MKNYYSAVLGAASFIILCSCNALNTREEGKAYPTDILMTLDGSPISCCLIEGKPAIPLNGLENYGFSLEEIQGGGVSVVTESETKKPSVTAERG